MLRAVSPCWMCEEEPATHGVLCQRCAAKVRVASVLPRFDVRPRLRLVPPPKATKEKP